MKKILSYTIYGLAAISSLSTLVGCSAENPFFSEAGEGTLRLQTVVNSTLTRAYQYNEEEDLRGNCVVYISDGTEGHGPLFKWRGLENVPDQVKLEVGHYTAEAWTGDSVSASWDKKFYYGNTPFDIAKDSETQVVVNCKIRNVVVAVNSSTIDSKLMKDDYSITVRNSKADLVFSADNVADNAYFMMPSGDSDIEYTITGTRADGKPFTKNGKIENVESAHKYILNFAYNPPEDTEVLGGAFISIKIEDEPIAEQSDVKLYSAPSINGVGFDIKEQQVFTNSRIPEMKVQICSFGNIAGLFINTDDFNSFGLPSSSLNLIEATENAAASIKDAGLTWESSYNPDKNLTTCYVTFSKEMLSKLPARDSEYAIALNVRDSYGKTSNAALRIATSESAIVLEDPIVLEEANSDDWQNVTAHSINLTFSLSDDIDGTPGVEYRVADSGSAWTFVPISGNPANAPRRAPLKASQKYSVKISGLTPGTRYEYRACARLSNGETFQGKSMYVSTESTFVIPNAGFEDWSSYSASTLLGTKSVTLPWNVGDKSASFWGSGNEGSATANMTLTDKSTAMVHSGTYCARLESKSAMGVIAAGNVFIGEYVKTDGTNGVLSLGRPYDGSHPTALRVYANYRPASGVKVKSGNESYVPSGFSGGNDHGQIYVALTTEKVEIRTNPSNRKLFDENDNVVVAYGQVTWTGNFGPDGALEKLEIPLNYKANAKTTKPTHLVVVCSASKYGDYFSGASGSVMCVDDFELVYE